MMLSFIMVKRFVKEIRENIDVTAFTVRLLYRYVNYRAHSNHLTIQPNGQIWTLQSYTAGWSPGGQTVTSVRMEYYPR